MICKFTKCTKILLYFWILSHIPFVLLDPSERCLNQIPEVINKKYSYYEGQETGVIIETSNRPLHRLLSEIFKIFLEEVIGHTNIHLVEEHDTDFDSIVKRMSTPKTEEVNVPSAMINLEVWVPVKSELKDLIKFQTITEFGNVAPPGRIGWFIPLEMDTPVRRYYKNWENDINEVHWTFLRDDKIVPDFDIKGRAFHIVRESLRQDSSSNFTFNCVEIPCKDGLYIPEQCRGRSCVLLLTSHYNLTKFVIDHINDLNLYVKVAWLGDKLNYTVNKITRMYKEEKSTKSLIILHYTPSDLILRENRFVSIFFKHCSPLVNNSIGCQYELNRLVKLSWNKIDNLGITSSLKSFNLSEMQYDKLLTLYENLRRTLTIDKMACEWMRQNDKIWELWQGDTESKRDIVIGGILPISGSSYNGVGILAGAILAQNAINDNTSILSNYNLQLNVHNGHCQAESVLRGFIEYIGDDIHNNLIGILGPACSDTVEPIAGVSRYYHTVVISYSAEGASFSDRTKYPYFFRTIGENKHYIHVYLKLFKKLGWTRVAALTEDGQKYTEYISHLQELLEENGINFIANAKFPRERETFQMTRYLEDLKRKSARIIICDVFDKVARMVMCEAYHLKMTSREGYVWFLPTWLNSTWYNTDHFNFYANESINCTTKQMIQAVDGYFSMSHAFFAPNDTNIIGNTTVKAWREKYYEMDNKIGHKKLVLSNYAGYAHDAVWTYALAFDKLIKNDPKAASEIHSDKTTNKLVQLIKETDFVGVSGRIKFRGGPSRFSIINVNQWYGNQSHTVGFFTPNLTDNKPEILGGFLDLNSTQVRWFTPDGKVPSDGTIPPPICAFERLAKSLNVTCEQAIVILNVILVTVLLIIVVAAIYFMKKRYDKKVNATKEYMRHLGIDLILNSNTLNDLDKWEIARNSVVINRKLGEGAFGTVYGGEADLPEKGWVAVAVKTLKVGSNTEEKLDFLSEAEVMKRFDHKNIVQLLGVCTKEEPIYTIMEFMLYGDLKTYLLARRHLVNKRSTEESEEISSRKLTSMALDVARGLSYLAELKYVHRDIASRNCLINAQRVVKLGDFGMTRPMFENDYYKFTRKGMLPVRWMSPESLALGVFSPASDVWSYGVLLYEIITFGSFPYQGMSNNDVLEYVKNGNTITIPQGVKPQLHGLLKSCWNQDTKERTRSSEIVEFLANNPRLLTPCLDLPLASVHLDDAEQMEFNLPDQFRKSSNSTIKNPASQSPPPTPKPKSPTTLQNGTLPLRNESYTNLVDLSTNGMNSIPMENCCPKEPLLGTAKSSSSLLKYVSMQHDRNGLEIDEDDYLSHNKSNGYVISKV